MNSSPMRPSIAEPQIRHIPIGTDSADRPIGYTRNFVAEDKGAVVAGIKFDLEPGGVGMVHSLWIDVEWQETNLPLRLMLAVLEDGCRRGCLKVTMDTPTAAYTAIAVLIDAGVLLGHELGRIAGQENPECYVNLYRTPGQLLADGAIAM